MFIKPGIGTIEQIEQKQIGAVALPFYTLRLAATNSLVLVPVSNALKLASSSDFYQRMRDALQRLSGDFAAPAHDWKDRFKDFSEKMHRRHFRKSPKYSNTFII